MNIENAIKQYIDQQVQQIKDQVNKKLLTIQSDVSSFYAVLNKSNKILDDHSAFIYEQKQSKGQNDSNASFQVIQVIGNNDEITPNLNGQNGTNPPPTPCFPNNENI